MTIGNISNRQIRKAVNLQAEAISGTIAPTLKAVGHDTILNRQRLDALEAWRDSTLWQRLRWLVRGYR